MTLIAALLTDFAQFISHYFLHRSAFLWNFHKVHHSAEVLTPITLYRAHPVEILFIANLTAVSTGLVLGVFNYFSLVPMGLVKVLQINFVVFFFNIVGSNLSHSHIWISYPSFLNRILLSPAQHQIHHSRNKIHFDKNLGSIFSFWDILFKSLYIPKTEEKLELGLPNQEHKEFSGLLDFYLLPFKKNFNLIFKRASKGTLYKNSQILKANPPMEGGSPSGIKGVS
jgi:sterol desaturase/sphingolipid hydroxylase (fatty acid hydroxylase superfamily)